jgi:hypothetical protein
VEWFSALMRHAHLGVEEVEGAAKKMRTDPEVVLPRPLGWWRAL